MPRKLRNYFILLFAIVLSVRILLVTYHHNNMGGIESNVVYGVQRILSGQPLYQDPSTGSYAVIQYTPLHYYLCAAFARLCGIGPSDVRDIFMLCRILALVCNLLMVGIVASCARFAGTGSRTALVFALPALIILTSHYFLRGDSLHLLFFSIGLLLYLTHIRSERRMHLIGSSLAAACCIMSKQSGILLPALVFVDLLLSRRKVAASALYSAIVVASLALLVHLCTGGNWRALYSNSVLGLKNGHDFSFLYRMFLSQFFIELVPCYVAAWMIFSMMRRKDQMLSFLATALVGSWFFAAFTGIKIGSSNNYFVEFLLILVIIFPYVLVRSEAPLAVRIGRKSMTLGQLTTAAIVIVLTSKTLGLCSAVFIDKSLADRKSVYERDIKLHRYFMKQLRLQPGQRVLFTDRNFLDNIFFQNSVMPTKDVVSEVYLADSITFNYAAFQKGMNSGLIQYIVTPAGNRDINRWQEQMPFMQLDTSNFAFLELKEGYAVYTYQANNLGAGIYF